MPYRKLRDLHIEMRDGEPQVSYSPDSDSSLANIPDDSVKPTYTTATHYFFPTVSKIVAELYVSRKTFDKDRADPNHPTSRDIHETSTGFWIARKPWAKLLERYGKR